MLSTNILFAAQIIIDFMLPFVQTKLAHEAITYTVIFYFGLLLIINDLINVEYGKMTVKESRDSRTKFIENALKQYSRLSQSDREGAEVSAFKRTVSKKEEAVAVQSWFKLSLKSALSLSISLLSTMWIIGSVLPLVYLAVLYKLAYVFIKLQMIKAKELREKMRKMNNRMKKQDDFQYEKLRIGHGNIQSIIERKEELNKLSLEMEWEWNKLSLLCTMPIIISMILSLLTCENKPINLVILCLTMLKSVKYVTNFFNSYEDTLAKEAQYDEYWEGKTYMELPRQFDIGVLTIAEYSFKGQTMWFNRPAVIRLGDVIRLTGKTGAGKTTFINALKGVREGLVLSELAPLNHFSHISHLRQDIRSAYHFSNISLSELFETTSTNAIMEVLEVVKLLEWYREEFDGDIFTDIDNNISGGQKTQLCLGITIMEGVRKQMIIMDEPEQGLHPEIIPEILESVFSWMKKKNPDLIIIFISHVCDCIVSSLPEHQHWHITRTKHEFNLTIL